ncbi:MAG: DUF4384 domain-containing protein [Pyrinomonadaceae bacterium]|nr:DUF4384 domain-containing protein [Pyrinomonadaceae bacterium]
MFTKHIVAVCLGVFCATAFSLTSFAQTTQAQDDETSARGAFFATRPGGNSANRPSTANRKTTTATTTSGASSTANKASNARRSDAKGSSATSKSEPAKKPASTSTARKSGAGTNKGGVETGSSAAMSLASAPEGTTENVGESVAADSIGLGYTLYMRADNGDAVRVDPEKEFGAGDQIRVSLEANTDGYLYIFHTEDDRNPQMLFPDARLSAGANSIRAHVPYQVPSSLIDWFKFDDKPAIEQLYIVLTRAPLPDVPTGTALAKYCGGNSGACVWRPAPQTWAQIKSHAAAPVAVSKSVEFGQKESLVERDALTRGIGLSLDAPSPSIVRMNTSSNKNILVTTIDLVHK